MARFIAIEGVDGTGKKTQLDVLVDFIKHKLKKPVLELDFPRYGHPSARYIERYLRGEYGTVVAPDLASFLYAFDRWSAKPEVEAFIDKHSDGFIVSNRYAVSNLAHQGGKIADRDARRRFYEEQIDLEFNKFEIPKPDINIVLLLRESAAQANVDKKSARSYTNKKRDLHEADLDHLKNAAAAYHELCQLYPADFQAVDCWDAQRESMKTIDQIALTIQNLIKNLHFF